MRDSSPNGETLLRMHRGLHEQGRPLGIDAAGQEVGRHLQRPLPELRDLVVLGDGVEVDHADGGSVLVLQTYPVVHGAQVVTDVELAGRLDAAEDRIHGHLLVLARLSPVN
jgi:hypothetical protein